jgi:hypothetical protein
MMFAISLFAIAAVSFSSVIYTSAAVTTKQNKMVLATQLVRGVVLDIEEKHQLEYLKDGSFPDELEGQNCDVPEPWDDVYRCSYDLVGLDADQEVMSALAQNGLAGMLGGQDPQAMAKNGMPSMESLGAQMDITKMMALAPLAGPEGPLVMQTCGINIGAVLQSLLAMNQTYPMIVQKAAEQTRKLTIRMTYNELGGKEQTLTIETFIIGIPRETLKQLEQQDQMESEQEVYDDELINIPKTPATGGTTK